MFGLDMHMPVSSVRDADSMLPVPVKSSNGAIVRDCMLSDKGSLVCSIVFAETAASSLDMDNRARGSPSIK